MPGCPDWHSVWDATSYLSCLWDRQDNLGEHLKSCWHGFRFHWGLPWGGLVSWSWYARFHSIKSDWDSSGLPQRVLWNVKIDEDVVQVNDDCNIDHVCKDVVHKSLESHRCVGKPFRHYWPLKGAISGSECGFPLIMSANMSFINHWKAAGALVNPSGITNHFNEPYWVLNVVFHLSPAATQTRWYACQRLILV